MIRKIGRTGVAAVSAVAFFGTAYAVMPYVALYQLGTAIRKGDAVALTRLVDWDGVREGIKEDICDAAADAPDTTAAAGPTALPPFGASFVRGIEQSAIDGMVTPDNLAAVARPATTRGAPVPPADDHGPVAIEHAFFDGPTSFSVVVRPDSGPASIRLELELRHGAWRVTRAWLPPEILEGAASRT